MKRSSRSAWASRNAARHSLQTAAVRTDGEPPAREQRERRPERSVSGRALTEPAVTALVVAENHRRCPLELILGDRAVVHAEDQFTLCGYPVFTVLAMAPAAPSQRS